jgi:pimeloyl-ACP methyl ester carboxylesterase
MREPLRLLPIVALLLAACGSGGAGAPAMYDDVSAEPPLETEQAKLDAALFCTPFEHPDKPPVLLVHGTFTAGYEQYEWTYLPLLSQRGFDVCYVSYPDRGLDDQQISAEYVVNALRRIRAESGRKVAMIGHSQGATMPRWALKWWPSARDAVEDFVPQAGPHHGLLLASQGANPLGQPAATYQFSSGSNFIAALNAGDETPGEVSYTNLYTMFDELVQPVSPVPTAALDFGQDNPRVSNMLLQDLCPGRFVDHVTIGLTDRLAFELTVDAISNPGPANFERAGGAALCGLASFVPDQVVSPDAIAAFPGIFPQSFAAGAPNLHMSTEEPPLKPYAQ